MTLYVATNEDKYRYVEGKWIKISHQPRNSDGRVLTVNPKNGILYVGTPGGVHYSKDGGNTWIPPKHERDITHLLFDSRNEFLYSLHLHDPINSIIPENQLSRSRDNGQTWQRVGTWPSKKTEPPGSFLIITITLDEEGGILYAGTTHGVFSWAVNGNDPKWKLVGTEKDARQMAEVYALAWDPQNQVLYAGTNPPGLVFRYDTKKRGGWQHIGATLSSGTIGIHHLAVGGGLLYAAAGNGRQVWWIRADQDTKSWEPVGSLDSATNQDDLRVLMLSTQTGTLYAGMARTGVFRSTDKGGPWEHMATGLPDPVTIVSFSEDNLHATLSDKFYPSYDEEFPPYVEQNGLPTLLRLRVPSDPVIVDPPTGAPPPMSLFDLRFNPAQIKALFGLQPEEPTAEVNQVVPGPTIEVKGPDGNPGPYHENWRQVYIKDDHNYPVLGGSLRLHGTWGDERVAVTNSFFPIPADYPFIYEFNARDLEKVEQAARKVITEKLSRTYTVEKEDRKWGLWGIVKKIYPEEWYRHYKSLIPGWRNKSYDTFVANMVNAIDAANDNITDKSKIYTGNEYIIPPPKDTITVTAIKFYDESDYAILPFEGNYYLVRRYQVQYLDELPWHVDIDMTSGRVIGQPWQATLTLPATFYQDSAEAEAGNAGGAITATWRTQNNDYIDELKQYWPGLRDFLDDDEQSSEKTTVAVQALKLFKHLREICGVATFPTRSKVDDLVVRLVQFDSANASMGFSFHEVTDPNNSEQKKIKPELKFWENNATVQDEHGGSKKVHHAARDPEVALHEFTHVFLWLLKPDPWDTLAELNLNPFSRALHEGYAMYLPQSLTTQQIGDSTRRWATAAYRDDDWKDRWALVRNKLEEGADLLPAPNVYPAGDFSTVSTTGYYQAYDVGMIWARALWELRELVGANHADHLAVQAYFYLHGHIVNFELAAEALLEEGKKLRTVQSGTKLNLHNSIQAIFAHRNIISGDSTHGFAQIGNTLIAAGDVGILISTDGGSHWVIDRAPDGKPAITQVAAIAASNNTFYAATQRKGVYKKAVNQANATWQLVPVPSASKKLRDDVTLLSLLALDDGRLVVGTNRGVFIYTTQEGWRSGGLEDFSILGLTLGETTSQFVQAYTSAKLYKIDVDTLFQPVSSSSAQPTGNDLLISIFDDGTATSATTVQTPQWKIISVEQQRFTALTTRNQTQVYAGALDGLQRILWNNNNFTKASTTANPPISKVLALAAKGSKVICATPNRLYETTTGVTFQSVGYGNFPNSIATVTSLFIAEDNNLLIGTLIHGIWRRNGTNWEQVFSPTPGPIELVSNEEGLFSVPLQTRTNLEITVPSQVDLLKVAQPGFPDNPIDFNTVTLQNGKKYTLSSPAASDQIILKLKNTGTSRKLINVAVSNNTISLTTLAS